MDWKGILKKAAIALLIPILLAAVAGIGFGVFWFFLRVTPESVMKKAVTSARRSDMATFKTCFSDSSTRALQMGWESDTGGDSGSWTTMMSSILEPTGAPPELGEVETVDDRAKIKLRLRNERRVVYFIKERTRYFVIEDWRIDVLSGIDEGISAEARKARAPKTVDPEKAAKQKELLEQPKEKGWWIKGDKKKKEKPAPEPTSQ
jgi:hypothetical protein